MNVVERQAVLRRWVLPSSTSEKEKQDRALRMVKKAIDNWPALRDDAAYRVYAKGSYANSTNVRLDSDVDIVVQNQNCLYYDYSHCKALPGASPDTYQGPWTPKAWRAEILAALKAAFPSEVTGSGTVAITIDEHDGTRPDIDVVPSFNFVRYYSADQTHQYKGSKVFPTSGHSIINFPDQQLTNGQVKNGLTNGAYKKYARALKSAENQLVKDGTIKAKPSYLMECLAFNVPNSVLITGPTLDSGFRATLVWLWTNLQDEKYVRENWLEPNKLKYVFRDDAKWTRDDAKELVLATWGYLGYTNA
jgi:hypothetical protein